MAFHFGANGAAVINFKGKGRGDVYMLILDERSSPSSYWPSAEWAFFIFKCEIVINPFRTFEPAIVNGFHRRD